MREILPFRAVDNGSRTRQLYNLEAEHLLRAKRSAELRAGNGFDPNKTVSLIGAVVSGVFYLAILICTLLYALFRKIFK